MTAKDILAKLKAVFADVATPPPAPAATVDTTKVLKTKDGTEVTVTFKDPAATVPAIGDMVTIGGAPAPAGDLAIEDGSVITVDGTGAITNIVAVVAPAAAATPPAPAPTPAPAPVTKPTAMAADAPAPIYTPKSPEEIKALYDKFATGTPEERLANLEIIAKALMEYNFGYEIRKGQADQAIAVYKEGLATAQTAVTAANVAMAKQDEKLKGLFELVEKLVEVPTADPKTIPPNKKEKFDAAAKKEARIEGIAAAIKKMRNK